jgi:transcription elongation factor S-II
MTAATTSPDIRCKIKNNIVKKTGLDDVLAQDMEIGIYNWTIQYSDENAIIKNWINPRFKNLYLEKARSVISNIDATAYIKNDRLLDRLQQKEFLPHDIPFMKPEHTFPERWVETLDSYIKKYENAYENKMVPMTDMFLCIKCKKRECTYYEVFSRSADEPAVIHIRCCNCGNSWKIG